VVDDLRYNFSLHPTTLQQPAAVAVVATQGLVVLVAAWSVGKHWLQVEVPKLPAVLEIRMMQTRSQVFNMPAGLQARTTKAAAVAAVGMAAAAVRVIEEAVAGQATSHFSQMHPLRPG
jgi:hypothetical protein